MGKKIKELVKNVNFDLRLAECILCLVDLIMTLIRGFDKGFYDGSFHYAIGHGWFAISLITIVGFMKEEPTDELQAVLLIMWSLTALVRLYNDTLLLIVGILMIVDIVFLCINMYKNK